MPGFFSSLLVLLASCSKNDPISDHINTGSEPDVHVLKTLKVCVKSDCVDADRALTDMYKIKDLSTMGNIAVVPHQAIVSTFAAIKHDDGKDQYAIFLTQVNSLIDGVPETCHACSPFLGAAIYQFHNQWKPYAVNLELGKFGSWGRVISYSEQASDIGIVPIGTEHFLITIKSQDGGQGYTSDFLSVIEVNPSGINQYENQIRYLGTIETAASDCGSGVTKGDDWISDIRFNINTVPTSITLTKKFKKSCTGEIVSDNPIVITYKYDGIEKKFSQEQNSQ